MKTRHIAAQGHPSAAIKPLRIAIIHFPFKGLTGSDRLIIDTALALRTKGNIITVFTADYNTKGASFAEEKELNIISVNTHIIGTIGGLGIQFFYFLRSIIFVLSTLRQLLLYDIILCDQLPTALFFLFLIFKLIFKSSDKRPILAYYCHFPESGYKSYLRNGPLARLNRYIFNSIEKIALPCVDIVYANSEFTKNAIFEECPSCKRVKVLYPGIPGSISKFTASEAFFKRNPICAALRNTNTLCSINRISGSKKLERVIFLANELKKRSKFTTVIAGGIGDQSIGGWEYLDTLIILCNKLSLSFTVAQANTMLSSSYLSKGEASLGTVDILFLLDATNDQRSFLLAHSKALFYSSSNEHFGMALPEGMLSHCLAIGMASGGPLEIIEHMVSGYLIPDRPDDKAHIDDDDLFSLPAELIDILERLYNSGLDPEKIPQDLKKIIQNGFNRAQSRYTMDVFTKTLLADYYQNPFGSSYPLCSKANTNKKVLE